MGMKRAKAEEKTSVANAVRGVRAELQSLANPAVAHQGRSFFKQPNDIRLYGVRVPVLRRLAAKLYRRVESRWDPSTARAFCARMIQEPQLEAKFVGIFLLGRYTSQLDRSLLWAVEMWIRRMHCASWAAIDALAPTLITPLIRRYPDLLPHVARWADSSNMWLRRAAVVTFVPLARRGQHLSTTYRLVRGLRHDREDLMHKACGWLLREAGKADVPRLERFLRRHGHTLPRTTVRYAIERFPEMKRKALLRETKH